MAQGWFARNFGWIGDDLRRAAEQLKRVETWVVIGILTVFGIIVYYGFELAKKTDSLLRFLRYQTAACQELTNGPIIFMFCGILFFALAATVTFGELTRHFDFKRRNAHRQARAALVQGITWCVVALSVAAGMLIYLDSRCL